MLIIFISACVCACVCWGKGSWRQSIIFLHLCIFLILSGWIKTYPRMSFLCTDCKTTCICGWVPVCVCANLNPVNLAFAFVFIQNARTPPATLFLFIVRLFGRKIIVNTYLNWTSYCQPPPHSFAIHEFTNALYVTSSEETKDCPLVITGQRLPRMTCGIVAATQRAKPSKELLIVKKSEVMNLYSIALS